MVVLAAECKAMAWCLHRPHTKAQPAHLQHRHCILQAHGPLLGQLCWLQQLLLRCQVGLIVLQQRCEELVPVRQLLGRAGSSTG